MSNEPARELRRDRKGPKLVRQASGQRAAAYIRQLIFDGELAPGAKIPQDEIATTLGISRIPVREALVALENEGRITIEMHRGAFVVALTEDSVRETMDLFQMMYDFFVRRAAERATPELLADLCAIQAEIDETDDPHVMWELNEEWVEMITSAGSAPRFARALSGLKNLVTENHFEVVPGAWEAHRKGTHAVTKAIVKHDPAGAARAWAAFSAKANRCVLGFFQTKGTFKKSDQPDYIDNAG